MTLGCSSSHPRSRRARISLAAGLIAIGAIACKTNDEAAALAHTSTAAEAAGAPEPSAPASSGAPALASTANGPTEAATPGAASTPIAASTPGASGALDASGPAPIPAGAPPVVSELLVGSDRGLEAWSLDGTRRRVISAGAARHPRWLDTQAVVVLAPRDSLALWAGGKLQRVALADGQRQDLATLPPFECKRPPTAPEAESFPYEVDLQDGGDFEVSPAAGLACQRLLDRNVNMASVMLDVRVDLRSQRVQRWLVMGGDDLCRRPRGVRRGRPPTSCSTNEPPAPSGAPARAYAHDMPAADGAVIQTTVQGARIALQLAPDYSPGARSPSGRWLVLGGDTLEGDYLYRRLSLLDRESGRVHPILETVGAWPAAIEPLAGSPPSLPHPIERAILVTGETDVRWLSTTDGEILVVGGSVVRPGLGSFSVDGELAR